VSALIDGGTASSGGVSSGSTASAAALSAAPRRVSIRRNQRACTCASLASSAGGATRADDRDS
jgi:hypothetical protein